MAKLTALPHQDIIDGWKGKIDFYVWMGIPCARRWPVSPGSRRAPAVEAQWSTWTDASRLWNLLSPAVQDAYRAMAEGINWSGRDIQVKSYITSPIVFL